MQSCNTKLYTQSFVTMISALAKSLLSGSKAPYSQRRFGAPRSHFHPPNQPLHLVTQCCAPFPPAGSALCHARSLSLPVRGGRSELSRRIVDETSHRPGAHPYLRFRTHQAEKASATPPSQLPCPGRPSPHPSRSALESAFVPVSQGMHPSAPPPESLLWQSIHVCSVSMSAWY